MFDPQTIELLDALPTLGDLNGERARVLLTRAYLQVIRLRTSPDNQDDEISEVLNYLRNLANGLELLCLIEFSQQLSLSTGARAAAFIAAQALEFIAELELRINGDLDGRHFLVSSSAATKLESGLLYLIAGYHANARTMGDINIPSTNSITFQSYTDLRNAVSIELAYLLVGLLRSDLSVVNRTAVNTEILATTIVGRTPSAIAASIETKMLLELSRACRLYLQYLSGDSSSNAEEAEGIVQRIQRQVVDSLGPNVRQRIPGEALVPHHLASLLEIVFRELQSSVTAYRLIPPDDSNDEYRSRFHKWVTAKVNRGYGLLWPPIKQWLESDYKNSGDHSLVSIPEGAGRDFLSEIVLARNLCKGWALYLVPNYRHVKQVESSLQKELKELGIGIRTHLDGERPTDNQQQVSLNQTVVVTTPEHASLALGQNPDQFKTCSVCLLDQCHLIGDEKVGISIEDVLMRITEPDLGIKLVLMSSILDDTSKLIRWLESITNRRVAITKLEWKPTRNVRCLTILNNQTTTESHPTQLRGYASLIWQTTKPHLLVDARLGINLSVKDEKRQIKWANSVNVTSLEVASQLARTGISTLLVLHKNPSHVWTHASACIDIQWQQPPNAEDDRARIHAWLEMASAELGQVSFLAEYLAKGVTVYSRALINEEKAAAEMAYNKRLVGLKIAMGDLPIGVNSPTQAVVMAGTGRSRYSETSLESLLEVLSHPGKTVTNNVGLSVIVPDRPVFSNRGGLLSPDLQEYLAILEHSEACVTPESALGVYVDALISATQENELDDIQIENPSKRKHIVVASFISNNDGGKSSVNFHRSYAAYLRQLDEHGHFFATTAETAATSFIRRFIAENTVPSWLSSIARAQNLPLFALRDFWMSLTNLLDFELLLMPHRDFLYLKNLFSEVIVSLHYLVLNDLFGPASERNGITSLADLPSEIGREQLSNWSIEAFEDANGWYEQWKRTFQILDYWMQGKTYTDIAGSIFGATRENVFKRSDRSPLWKAIKNTDKLRFSLSNVAYAFTDVTARIAIDKGFISKVQDLPLHVRLFSQSVRWGVDRIDKALWYKNFMEQRSLAHLLGNYEGYIFPVPPDISEQQLSDNIYRYSELFRHNPNRLAELQVHNELDRRLLDAVVTVLKS